MVSAAEKRKRRRERKQRLEEDVNRVIKNKTPNEQVADLPNEDLFFIDEEPTKTAARRRGRGSAGEGDSVSGSNDKKKAKALYAKPNQKSLDRVVEAKEREDERERKERETQVYDLWGGGGATAAKKVALSARRKKEAGKAALRAGTVIEPAGCSYNPRYDDHQDVVAEVVAEQVQKNLLESANQEWSLAVAEGNSKKSAAEKRLKKPHEVSNQNVVSVKKTLKAIRKEERERGGRIKRKKEEAEEKKKHLPPRLGRKRFEPEENKVATTDDIDGSIRTLRSTPMVANAVFNKLQRKGLIEPRDQAVKRRRRRYVRA